jgi:hypothetical protein
MSSIQSELDKLNKEAAEKTAEVERLTRLAIEFPNLQKHVGRWNKVAYYSISVNSRVDQVELRHNCGCCHDSPLEAWPYLEVSGGRVYSDPPCFSVGEKHYQGGDKPYPRWREELKAVGISDEVIEVISVHFRSDKEARIRAAEEDDEVSDDPESFI